MISSSILSKKLLQAIRVSLTVLIVAYAVNHLNWQGLIGTLEQINPLKMVAAICLQGCAITVAVSRWQMLLANQDINLSWSRTVQLVFIGLFFNLFFLGSLGGDAAKFVGSIPHAPERKARLALSLIQDRLIGMGGLLLLMTGLITVNWPVLWTDPTTRPLTLIIPGAGAVFIATAITLWTRPAPNLAEVPKDFGNWRRLNFRALRESFPQSVFLRAMSLSLAIHTLVIVAGYLAAQAVGIDLSLSAAGFVVGTTALVLSLPITVAGLGVRDGTLIWLIGIFGFRAEQAIALSACLLSINLFWAFAGGLAFYWPAKAATVPNKSLG